MLFILFHYVSTLQYCVFLFITLIFVLFLLFPEGGGNLISLSPSNHDHVQCGFCSSRKWYFGFHLIIFRFLFSILSIDVYNDLIQA